MSKQAYTVELSVPDGYDVIGYGAPSYQAEYLCNGEVKTWTRKQSATFEAILVRKQQWRTMTPRDVLTCLLDGPIKARVRHFDSDEWRYDSIAGAKSNCDGEVLYYSSSGFFWSFAEIPIPVNTKR